MSQFSIFNNQIEENPDNTVEHDLYNSENFLISKEQVQSILSQCEIDYDISDLELYQLYTDLKN